MIENENKRLTQQRDRLEESKKIKDNLLNQKDHLERVKQEKLDLLEQQNIANKYRSELSRKKIFGVS